MGQSHSSPLETCLTNICNGRSGCVAFPGHFLYQEDWVQPYNLAVNVTPIAVIRPDTADDVAAIIKCASQNSVKVQAKSGGHSYAYGSPFSRLQLHSEVDVLMCRQELRYGRFLDTCGERLGLFVSTNCPL